MEIYDFKTWNQLNESNYEKDLKEFIYNGYLAFEEGYPEAAKLFDTHEKFLDVLYSILVKRLPQIIKSYNKYNDTYINLTFDNWLHEESHDCPYFNIPVSVFKMNIED